MFGVLQVSNYISNLYKVNELPIEVVRNLLNLTRCTSDQIPSIEISLDFYCYMEGVKGYVKSFLFEIHGNDDGIYFQTIEALGNESQNTQRDDIKNYFELFLKEFSKGIETLLDKHNYLDLQLLLSK